MRRRSSIDETPQSGPTEISRDIFEHGIVDGTRRSRELAEGGDMVPNVRATRHISIHELTKKGSVRETLFVREVSMLLGVLEGALFLVQ